MHAYTCVQVRLVTSQLFIQCSMAGHRGCFIWKTPAMRWPKGGTERTNDNFVKCAFHHYQSTLLRWAASCVACSGIRACMHKNHCLSFHIVVVALTVGHFHLTVQRMPALTHQEKHDDSIFECLFFSKHHHPHRFRFLRRGNTKRRAQPSVLVSILCVRRSKSPRDVFKNGKLRYLRLNTKLP